MGMRSRIAVVPSTSCDYQFWYTAVPLTACSRLFFWWFALPSAELSGDETLMTLRALSRAVPFVFDGYRWLKYRKIGWCHLGSSGVLEVVSVVLVKVSVESGVVVLIPACSGEICCRFSSSPMVTSRLGHDR
ncbi:hypothetical protein HID58_094205 [Brassica napus]|uniref:Uncharacterized protein n=1 Tax=Brassica napus TaxID=3708 RepID=A0ABQ7X851_BRANA|nr:hypothetical protein HID58_094208 [Brassica napus]KAH0852115.1 hypothetical protein HID58_094205 [Brassica napus]